MRRAVTHAALVALLLALGAPAALAVAPQEHAGEAPAQEPEHAAPQDPEHAAEGEHAAEEHHGPTMLDYAFKWINFVLLLALLWWLLVTPPAFVKDNFDFDGLKVVLAARSTEIVRSRDLAREQTEAAATRLRESETRLARVEEEAGALVTAAHADADRERARLVAEAEAEAAKIRDLADRDMGAEVARARRSLRHHVADLSVSIATDLVKNNLSGADQERLVREYLDRLGHNVA